MPRQKKPAQRRQQQGSGGRDIGLVPAPTGEIKAPAAEKAWLAATKTRWTSFWGSNVAQIVERDSDLPALRRLFGYYDEMERSERALRKKRFVKGSTGQPRLNPAAKYVTELEGLIRQLEDRFGLSPLARRKLQWEVEQAAQAGVRAADTGPKPDADRLRVIAGGA